MSAYSNALHRASWPRLSARGLLERFASADAFYRQRQALASLDERMLQDIGVARAEVDAELRRPFGY